MKIIEQERYDPLKDAGSIRLRFIGKDRWDIIDDMIVYEKPKDLRKWLLIQKLKNNAEVSKVIVTYYREPTNDELKQLELVILNNPRTFTTRSKI